MQKLIIYFVGQKIFDAWPEIHDGLKDIAW